MVEPKLTHAAGRWHFATGVRDALSEAQ
jgi:hypothetical protein